jgi:uncharacterized protein
MRLSPERVAGLAALLVDKLVAAHMLDPVLERKALVTSLERVMVHELSVEDRINAEAKELMRQHNVEIARGQLDEHQLFQMIKKQLVRDRNVIL